MTIKHLKLSILATTLLFSTNLLAGDNWYIKPSLGLSALSDQTGIISGSNQFDGSIETQTDSGFVSGLALGYRYGNNVSAELVWEYRSNDANTTIINTSDFYTGNYASNLFYINGYYHFAQTNNWQHFVGAGVGWTQEIDIDLEQNGVESSFSGDGDIAFQVMAGSEYLINDRVSVVAEVRYGAMSSVKLEGEENANGTLSELDYNPLTLSLGLTYRF